jgi:glutamate synthase (ferredoxin)
LVNEIIRDQVDKGFITGIELIMLLQITTKLLQKILKIMNKIGISTLHSYRAAQILKF